jgi:EAL domain-containing protein (putative c-di-GMP-specific phosphodiesterase class I)
MSLIRDIDKAPATKQEMLAALVKLARDLGTTPLAEGVETEEEHEVCKQMNFELGQGYLYGRPASFF